MGEYIVGKIALPYNPTRLLNNSRHKKRARYVMIASREGKAKALEALEKDYLDKMLEYHTYRKIKEFLIYKVREIDESKDGKHFEKLVKILDVISFFKTLKITDISTYLKLEPKEVLDIIDWGKKHYPSLLNAVYRYIKKQES